MSPWPIYWYFTSILSQIFYAPMVHIDTFELTFYIANVVFVGTAGCRNTALVEIKLNDFM